MAGIIKKRGRRDGLNSRGEGLNILQYKVRRFAGGRAGVLRMQTDVASLRMGVIGDGVVVTEADSLESHQRRTQKPQANAGLRNLDQSSKCQHRRRGLETKMLCYNKFKMHNMPLSNYSFFLSWRRTEDEVP